MITLEYIEHSNTYKVNDREVASLEMINTDDTAVTTFSKAGLELDISSLNICDAPTLHEEYTPTNSNPRIFTLSEFGGDEIGEAVLYKDLDSDNCLIVEVSIHLYSDQKEL